MGFLAPSQPHSEPGWVSTALSEEENQATLPGSRRRIEENTAKNGVCHSPERKSCHAEPVSLVGAMDPSTLNHYSTPWAAGQENTRETSPHATAKIIGTAPAAGHHTRGMWQIAVLQEARRASFCTIMSTGNPVFAACPSYQITSGLRIRTRSHLLFNASSSHVVWILFFRARVVENLEIFIVMILGEWSSWEEIGLIWNHRGRASVLGFMDL